MIADLSLVRRRKAAAAAAVAGAPLAPIRRADWQRLPLALALADTAALILAVVAAGWLRLRLDQVSPVVALGYADRHVLASVLVLPLLLVMFRLRGLYDAQHILAGSREYAQVAHAATYGVLLALGVSYFLGETPVVSRSWLLLVWAASIVCVGAGRFAARRVVRHLRRRGAFRTRVAIVGASEFGIAIAEQFRAAAQEGVDVVGFLDEYIPLGQPLLGSVAVIGRPADLLRGGPRGVQVDEYVLVPQALPHERLAEITQLMLADEGPTLRLAVSSQELLTHGVQIGERANVPLATLRRASITGVDAVLKRALDLLGASLALLLVGPPALWALLRARLAGERRLLRTEPIQGVHGQRLALRLLAPAVSGWVPLRGVPALFAVLAGRLSLVGPRPVLLDERAPHSGPPPLSGQPPLRNGRAPLDGAPCLGAVKPGLTGPWRLCGPTASLGDQAARDLAYVRSYSIWEDLRVLWVSVRCLRDEAPDAGLGRWAPAAAEVGSRRARRGGMSARIPSARAS